MRAKGDLVRDRKILDSLREGDLGRVEGLRSAGVEDDEHGVGVGGGERGENGDELGVGWIYEGEMEPRVRDGVIGSV
jgi:hypothetical protein